MHADHKEIAYAASIEGRRLPSDLDLSGLMLKRPDSWFGFPSLAVSAIQLLRILNQGVSSLFVPDYSTYCLYIIITQGEPELTGPGRLVAIGR